MINTEIAKQLRAAIKSAGFKASVTSFKSCGSRVVNISVVKADIFFTSDQIKFFCEASKSFGLTMVRKCDEIDPIHEMQLTGKRTWKFYC